MIGQEALSLRPRSTGQGWPERAARLRSRILEYLRSDLGFLEPDTAQPLEDLGLDSVELVGLLGCLEQELGVELSPALIAEVISIDELCKKLDRLPQERSAAPSQPLAASGSEREHAFTQFVNPSLGRRLAKLEMAKTFTRASGLELHDSEGRRYLDFMAGYGALPFGFNPPDIWAAIRSVEEDLEPSFATPSLLGSASRLAARLIAAAPEGLRYVTFANSGAEAIEAAIKLARAATGRQGILTATNSFHGKTLGALSATGNPIYHARFGVPAPGFSTVPFADLDALDECLRERSDHFAAFIVEPILGEGGAIPAPKGYLHAAREICRSHGTLFAVDEIQTGLGRTGALFASLAEDVRPDIMTLAKALGGGLVPIGAVLYSDAAFSDHFNLKHSSTFAGNALGCRAGLATLARLEHADRALVRHVETLGGELKRGLEELWERYPGVIADVRGRGFMLGIELQHGRSGFCSGALGLAAEQGELAPIVCGYLLNAEAVRIAPTLNGSNVLRVAPALIAEKRHCEEFLEKLERTLELLARGESGVVIGSLLRGTRVEPSSQGPRKDASHLATPRSGDRRFAFLVNPSRSTDFVRFDPSLAELGGSELDEAVERFGELLGPFTVSSTRIESDAGSHAFGEFIVVPRTPEKLMAMDRREASAEVATAARLARRCGARVIGLGAYTSIVTAGGGDLHVPGVAFTSGNSFTVVAGCAAIELATSLFSLDESRLTAAVMGAGGSIGSAMASMLTARFQRLVLVGNPDREPSWSRQNLLAVGAEMCRHVLGAGLGREPMEGSVAAQLLRRKDLPHPTDPQEALVKLAGRLESDGLLVLSQDPDASLPLSDVVVTATSSPRGFISPWNLRAGAVVCDLSQPPNVSAAVRDCRPDVLVIDGAVVDCPGQPSIGPFGLERGLAYPCMAETMMLALEGIQENFGIGPRLLLKQILLVHDLASKHGFKVKQVRSFGKLMNEQDWQRSARARRVRRESGRLMAAGD